MTDTQPKYGTRIPYDPQWKGPLSVKDRQLTDVCFFIAFVVYMAVWTSIGVYAFHQVEIEEVRIQNHGFMYPRLYKLYEIWHDEKYSHLREKILFIILLSVFVAAAIPLSIVVMLQWWTLFFTWVSIGITCLFLVILACVSMDLYYISSDYHYTKSYIVLDSKSFIFYAVLNAVCFVGTILVAICFRTKINIASEFVREGSKAATHFPLLYFIPIFVAVMDTALTIAWGFTTGALCVIMYLTPDEHKTEHMILLIFNFVGLFWSVNFLEACAQISKSRFNLGTAALGSMILTIFQKMKYIIEMNRRIVSGNYDHSNNFVFDRCYDILRCLEYLLKYINDYACVICGVHGLNFFSSAKYAFNLVMRSFSVTVMSMWSETFIIFSYELTTVVTTTLLALYLISSEGDRSVEEAVVATVALLAVMIAEAIFSILKTAIDSIFLCALEDLERNDGSSSKPYYMSEKLRIMIEENR